MEIHDVVSIPTESRADVWALRLIQCLVCLEEMVTLKKTREIPVFGYLENIFVTGIIDQIEFCVDTSKWILSDTKTRFSRKSPRESQKKSTYFQLMIYKSLYDCIITKNFLPNDFLCGVQLTGNETFSDAIQNLISSHFQNLQIETIPYNLNSLLNFTLQKYAIFPELSPNLKVEYIYQKNSETIFIEFSKYEKKDLELWLHKAFDFWKGKSVQGVDVEDIWKCNHCQYFGKNCKWIHNLLE